MKLFCMKALIITLISSLANLSYANEMKSSFNEAMSVGKTQNGQVRNVITSFDPNTISDNYNPRPSEINLKGNVSNLNNLGMSELNNSEVGKTINTSTVNNPKVHISEDADFIKGTDDIRQNADVISGVKSGRQCVKQVLSKSTITNHYCEKDQEITKTCKIRNEIKWVGSRSIKHKQIIINEADMNITNHSTLRKGRYDLQMTIPENNAVMTGYDFSFKNNGWGSKWTKRTLIFPYIYVGNIIEKKFSNNETITVRGLSIPIHNKIMARVETGGAFARWEGNYGYLNSVDHQFTIYYTVEEDTLEPKIHQVSDCNEYTENSIEVSSQCTQKGGVRKFVKDGKSFELTSDCWETQVKYAVSEASDNECKAYEKNPNCSVAERECILNEAGNCTRFRNKYQCSVTTKTDGHLCGDEFFCSDGSCSELDNSVNTNFGHAVSQLANLAKAAEDYNYSEQKFTAFTGNPMFCRKSGFGYSDCCKDSGWGQSAGLAKCNGEEQMLGQAKEKKTAVFVGTFCSKKVLGKCIKRKSSYCVFDNKLARITQVQGRSGQLGIGFGGAKNPNCRGLSVEELSRINFNNMNYSDFYEELNSNTQVPDKDQLIKYMKNSITEQMQQ